MATIRELEDKYNPENDLIPGAPEVTWTEYELLQLIKKLERRILILECVLEGLVDPEGLYEGKAVKMLANGEILSKYGNQQ